MLITELNVVVDDPLLNKDLIMGLIQLGH